MQLRRRAVNRIEDSDSEPDASSKANNASPPGSSKSSKSNSPVNNDSDGESSAAIAKDYMLQQLAAKFAEIDIQVCKLNKVKILNLIFNITIILNCRKSNKFSTTTSGTATRLRRYYCRRRHRAKRGKASTRPSVKPRRERPTGTRTATLTLTRTRVLTKALKYLIGQCETCQKKTPHLKNKIVN